MTELSREDEILLREYAQAGEACRANDTLVRTGLTIFGGVQAAIIGFVASRGDTSITVEMILLELLGLWLSVVVYYTTRRLHYRYKNYMERARCIERQIGMNLYQFSYEYFGSEPVPAKWAGNKKLWASVPAVTFGIYIVLLLHGLWPWRGALPVHSKRPNRTPHANARASTVLCDGSSARAGGRGR